jgi:PAS domain S-box-containing protein
MIAQDNILPRLRRMFWMGAAFLVALGLTFALVFWVNSRSITMMLESQRIGRIARESRALTIDRESGIRRYLLSKHPESLAPALTARAPLNAKLDSLISLTGDDPSMLDRAKTIRSAVGRWERGWAVPTLSSGELGAKDDLAGKELFDSIRAALDSFLASQQRVFRRRVAAVRFVQNFSMISIAVELLILLGILRWFSARAMKQARMVIEHQTTLEEQAVELEQQAAELEERSQALEETQSLLDFVMNNSPVGVALFDSNHRIVLVNAAVAAMSGVPTGHAGRMTADFASDDITEVIDPLLDRVLTRREPVVNVPVSGTNRVDMGRERHFLCSFFPILLPGKQPGAGGVILETTQYRQLEEQLLQAQKMEAVGRLAGGVAHDFNNMLTAILSYGDLLLSELPQDSPHRADVQEMVKAADKASDLTRQLLAFSRQQVLRPMRVDLNATVDGLSKMIKRLASNNIELITRLDRNLWPVTADPAEIERVLTNLVLNSRDAMPNGGRLIIETENADIDDEYVRNHADVVAGRYAMIAVTDTGEGMTREVRERLFEPFFTTKEKGKGTGLGLSSVYGIVKQSGGFVWVYSEPGHGTTFKIYLPKSEVAEKARQSTPSRNPRIGPETILIVEDDENVRQVATRILKSNGYRVLEASNGAEALTLCEAEEDSVDLVVTDIVMPGMGGAEFAQVLRSKEPDARILFTSGYTGDVAFRQNMLHEGEAFLEKPFTPNALAKKAREILDGHHE